MSGMALVLHQFRFDQKVFWRNPAAVFFTAMLPLIFLFILASVFKNADISARREGRDLLRAGDPHPGGDLGDDCRRWRRPPVSPRGRPAQARSAARRCRPGVFIAGRIGNSLVISLIMVVLVSVIGALVYGVTIPSHTLPAMLVTLAVGGFSFCCLGIALAAVIPSQDAAAADRSTRPLLPLYFLSGVFIPEDELPNGVISVSPTTSRSGHFFEAMFAAWDPHTTGAGFEWGNLAVVAVWGVAGLLLAIRFFRWEPRR